MCVRRTPKGLACSSVAAAAANGGMGAPGGVAAAAASGGGGGSGGAGAVILDESIWHAFRGIARTVGHTVHNWGAVLSLTVPCASLVVSYSKSLHSLTAPNQ